MKFLAPFGHRNERSLSPVPMSTSGARAVATSRSALAAMCFIAAAAISLVAYWDASLPNDSPLVVYFGRPRDVLDYVQVNPGYLMQAAASCFLSAALSLFLASLIATATLTIGLLREGWLRRIEHLAAAFQTVPFLVVVTVFLLLQRALFDTIRSDPPATLYSLAPVAVSLAFAPIVYGAKAIARTQIQVKSLLRIWDAPVWWRISRIYIPGALPEILTGLRASAAWAIGAVLISDGLVDGVELNARTLGHLLVRPFSSAPLGQTPTVVIIATALAFLTYYLFVGIQLVIERRLLGAIMRTEEAYSLQRG